MILRQTSDKLLKATVSASSKFLAFEKDRAKCEWKELTDKVSANGTMVYDLFKYV